MSSDSKAFHVPLQGEMNQTICELTETECQFYILMSKHQLRNIIDSVVNTILNWTLIFEENGVVDDITIIPMRMKSSDVENKIYEYIAKVNLKNGGIFFTFLPSLLYPNIEFSSYQKTNVKIYFILLKIKLINNILKINI